MTSLDASKAENNQYCFLGTVYNGKPNKIKTKSTQYLNCKFKTNQFGSKFKQNYN